MFVVQAPQRTLHPRQAKRPKYSRRTVGRHDRHGSAALGSLMALTAGGVWSFGAIAARKADSSDAFQYLIWRSIGIIIVIEVWSLFRRRPQQTVLAYTSGRRMLLANVALLLASIGFVYAVKVTTAANAAFLGSTTPLFSVCIARFVLGERLNRRTIGAIALALSGLMIMVIGDLEVGSIVGDLAALSSAMGFAVYTVVVRSRPQRDWSPVLPGYAVLMIAICATITVSQGNTLTPPAEDVALALLHGGVIIVIGTYLYNTASRSVPAAAMTVFVQTEMVLVPVWAFLLLSERPPTATVIGGTVIMIAVIGKAILDARQVPEPAFVPV
jgi:drug/metabolite transporter (DMT)-like permease